jgi:hypothetical protein
MAPNFDRQLRREMACGSLRELLAQRFEHEPRDAFGIATRRQRGPMLNLAYEYVVLHDTSSEREGVLSDVRFSESHADSFTAARD